MKIAIDVSPLKTNRSDQHSVRGSGFYIEYLVDSLQKYFPEYSYSLFTESIPAGVDIVHYPYFEPFFLTLPLIKKSKSVVTIHDVTPLVFPKEFPAGLKGNLRWQIQRVAVRFMDQIITDSQASKKDIQQFLKAKKDMISVVYLAQAEQYRKKDIAKKDKETLLKKYNIPEKFLLYVGDVTWNKNLPRIVTAAAEKKIPLVLIGKALTSTHVDTKNKWNKDLVTVQSLMKQHPHIFPLGFVSKEELVDLYNVAYALVMPSLYEGFGLPVLEAMICGCPVITSAEGSLKEIAGEGAFYVDPHRIDSIADGMEKVFTDDLFRKKLIDRGFKNCERFSWKKTAEQTIEVYKRVVNQ